MIILTMCVLRTQGLCMHVLAFVCALIITECLKHTGCMCISMSQYLYMVRVVIVLLYVSAY